MRTKPAAGALFVATVVAALVLAFRGDDSPATPAPAPAPTVTTVYYGAPAD
jgi:hypothetical protein